MKTNQSFPSTRARGTVLLASIAALSLALSTGDLFAPPPGAGAGKATAVRITIMNRSGDRILSDGIGPYVNGVDKVTAVIHNTGQLELETGYNSATRTVGLDYSDILSGTGCGPDDTETEIPDLNCNGSPDDPAFSMAWARLFTLDLNLLAMTPGSFASCGFGVNFDDRCSGGKNVPWRIRFQHQGTQDSAYACGAGCSAQVRVDAYDFNPQKGIAGGVDTWIITADVVSGAGAEACLWSGGPVERVLREIVRMPFQLLVQLK